MKHRISSAVVNIAIAVLVLISWLYMMGLGQSGAFSATGWAALRYYTVLSNLLEGVTAALLAVQILGTADAELRARVQAHKKTLADKVARANEKIHT